MSVSYIRLCVITVLLVLLVPFVIFSSNYFVQGFPLPAKFIRFGVPVFAAAVAVFLGFLLIMKRLHSVFIRVGEQQAAFLDRLPEKYLDGALFTAAAASLFLELAIIRWQAEIFPIFALYKNYSLLSCFMGLGLGYALARRSAVPLIFSIPVLAVQFLLLMFLRYGVAECRISVIWRTPFVEQANMGLANTGSLSAVIAIYSFLTVVFLLSVIVFLPIGQVCGRLMARRENLRAYGFNLLGSLAGVLLMNGVSLFWTPPTVWFCIGFAALLVFFIFDVRVLLWGLAASFAAVIILSWPVSPGWELVHTPYQLLERGPGDRGLTCIKAAGHYYQRIHDLSRSNANVAIDSSLRSTADYYNLPFRVFGRPITSAAIVGSGTGNDVAAALRNGVSAVDAIEIDPGILLLGRRYHPEKPYQDPRVTAIVNDARTFLRRTRKTFDMVLYGLLDSHTLLSHGSSVRLDSFVYTVEALSEARARLNRDGILCLSFCVLSDDIGRKIYRMMETAFDGIPPVCVRAGYDHSVIFFQARDGGLAIDPALLEKTGFEDVSTFYANPAISADVSTDDWPFFYMPRRVYPVSYLYMVGLIILLSAGLVRNFTGERPSLGNLSFFFMGAGFMLVETRAITELGLTFGNTWHVIGIAIAGVLLMAFLANAAVGILHIRHPAGWFMLLIASLAAGFMVSGAGGLGVSAAGKMGTLILITCPMFFSGIVFSALLSRTSAVPPAMAVNLLGSMVGGLLEYNAMYFGFRSLYLLAIMLYGCALVSLFLRGRRSATPAIP